MKIKNIFLLILIAVSMQNASAAVMTIYNDTGGNVDLTARWESKSDLLECIKTLSWEQLKVLSFVLIIAGRIVL